MRKEEKKMIKKNDQKQFEQVKEKELTGSGVPDAKEKH